jgi:tRNA nucleotidyltransferase (CCA-adding enzyme)
MSGISMEEVVGPSGMWLSALFDDAGFTFRMVGGAVRDLLLRHPPKDIDFATCATPEEMVSLMVEAGVYIVGVTDELKKGKSLTDIRFADIPGIQHGTVTAVIDHVPYEITTLRVDTETNGRHAKTAFIRDWRTDAERRDLTMNAMSMDMAGTLYDYFNGYDDLLKRLVRFVGDADQRIIEDYLRILRYFRFYLRYDNALLDEDAVAAIHRRSDGLLGISGERKWLEMSKIMTVPQARLAIGLPIMAKTGVLENIGLGKGDTDAMILARANTSSPIAVLASGLRDAEAAHILADLWRLKNADRALLAYVAENQYDLVPLKLVKDRLVDGVPRDHLTETLRVQGRGAEADILVEWAVPTFPVKGRDILAKGFAPGPQVGEVQAALRERWKDSGFMLSAEELLDGLSPTSQLRH